MRPYKGDVMSKYMIEVASHAYNLCVFLNDGVEIENPDNKFLAVEINSPREITTKVISEEETKTAKYKDFIPLV
jgi:hypothetical protein